MLDRPSALNRVRRRARGLSGRLIASYILVTFAVVVLVEMLVLGYQVLPTLAGSQLQAQVDTTASSYAQRLAEDYPRGVPVGTVLDDPVLGHPGQAINAVVAVGADGTVVASSAPARYPPGRPAASDEVASPALPGDVDHIKSNGTFAPYGTPDGDVLFDVARPPGHTSIAYVYVQAPWSAGFVNPISGWRERAQLGQAAQQLLVVTPLTLLAAIVPVGFLFGLAASWRLVRRVRRLERATLAVADGDYTVALPASGRDELGRLEANFTTMTRQLGSAMTAQRQRAADDARAAERARIAREMHDAISQHLFALRMIAAGMRRADPGHEQAQVIERVSEEALRDMQALLAELRPAGLDGAGLTGALRELCANYHDRLGVVVDASLDDVTVPAPVGHALLRITQEACANAVRHGAVRKLAVSLTRQPGQVELTVRDEGTGFDPAAGPAGSGLAHIRARVAELGGSADIDSAPGCGTSVTVRVPVA
ncbi:MAG: histidine kinase [Streptosporangiaceae bacterium]